MTKKVICERLEKLEKRFDEIRFTAEKIDVVIGKEKKIWVSPWSFQSQEYMADVYVDLQKLIVQIMEHCKLTARFEPPVSIPKKLVVEKSKDGTQTK